jgi:DNA-nicking Smr family endonuclease
VSPKKPKGGRGSPFDALRPMRDAMAAKESARPEPAKKPPPLPPPKLDRRPPAEGSAEEELLLHRLFAGVTPLDRSHGRIARQGVEPSEAVQRVAKRGPEQARIEADEVHDRLRALVEGAVRFEVTDDGRRVEGRRVDLAIDVVRKLRRGHMPIDARLDLHGLKVAEARAQVEQFLRTMRAQRERCVLVIHGKGEHSAHGAGILRGEIGAWLSQGAASEHVAAFATAQEVDGGEGAVYILLRR